MERINDNELESIIRDRLDEDPDYYLQFLKRIIDEIPLMVSEKELFESLKPSFTQKSPPLEEIFSGDAEKVEVDTSLTVSPEGVDRLFYPDARKKIKQWQQKYFDETLSEEARANARKNIKKVFESLIYKGQGRPDLSQEVKRDIRSNFRSIDSECRQIFEQAQRSEGNRCILIKQKFPDVGKEVVVAIRNSPLPIKRAERLRNIIISKICKCSIRAVEECVREFQLQNVSKALSEHGTITIRGRGKKAEIAPHKPVRKQ